MIKLINKNRYDIPPDTEERFDFLTNKIAYAKRENHIELYRGLLVVFDAEFKKFRVK